jgi:hypothetical protein
MKRSTVTNEEVKKMKTIQKTSIVLLAFCLMILLNQANYAQKGAEEFTGNIFSYNGPRVETANFSLKINHWTSDEQATENLSILQNDGQDKLLSAIRKEDVGTLSVNSGLAQTINVVRQSQVDGKTRIFAVFERWTRFAEVRGGYRSLDYPFGVIEIMIDPATGKGEGTLIAAAQIRWNKDKKTNENKIEIENFATYPAKLVDVKMNGEKM